MAQAPVIFCADIGTSSLKAALIDVEGRMKAFARKAYPHEKVRAEDWEAALISATEQLLATGIKPAAVCISGNGPTLVPYTRKGTALYPLHWYDLPKENGDDEALARFASSAKAKSLFLPHVKSFSQVQPSAYEETLHFFSPQEWLSFCLGADPVAVLSSPALLPYYWEEDQCAALELDLGKFPPFAELGSVIGKVSRSASERFKLPAGIPVAAGGPDFLMALLGVGAIEPGLVCDRAGTSEGINVCSAFPIQSKVLRVLPHLQEGLWNIGGVFASSGKLFEWYRTLTGQGERAYEDILSELINPDGSLPCARAKQSAKTFFFPQFGILSESPVSRTDLGRSVLKALGFLIRGVIETLEEESFAVKEMRVSGGQGKSPLWNQLKADITGVALQIPEICDGELAGDAVLGAIALGESAGLTETVRRMIRISQRYAPRPELRAQYLEEYSAYRARQRASKY